MPASAERLTSALRGRYDILRPLGEGGMALVFLAEDCRHHREVAVKVLRPELAASLGADRFLREIAIAARLTHPNILPLLDSGEAAGVLYYVMPYVAGESLRERLAREGQLPVEEAMKIAHGAALGLGYAHGMGVVHRDIKPGNILLSGGEPVLADFGIARAVSAAGETRLTESGFAVGTASYMSPEQAANERQLDGRSDLYSLGCVLYEMLAGAPPYTGPSLHAITARKLTEPVPPLRTVRETVPVALEEVVGRCLARLPADRYATARHLADALETARPSGSSAAITATAVSAVPVPSPRPGSRLIPWVVAVLALLSAAALGLTARRSGESALRLSVTTPAGTELYGWSSPVALSPDGKTLVFAAGHDDSVRLYRRRLDSFAAHPLPGTEGGDSPFFSPDGRWVGFFARKARQLRKVALAGGSPVTIAEDLEINPESGVWGPDDTIYFANYPDQQVSKVAAGGGPVHLVTQGVPERGWFRFPLQVLLDDRRALVWIAGASNNEVDLVSLESGENALLLERSGAAWVMGKELLLYVPWGRPEVAAQAFDPDQGRIRGDPITVLDSVATGPGGAPAYLSLAANGTLAYVPLGRWLDPRTSGDFVLVSRSGAASDRALPAAGGGPRFSPDGKRLVYTRSGRHGQEIRIFDLATGAERTLADAGQNMWPIFFADGRRVVFNSNRADPTGYMILYSVAADGSGEPVRLPTDSTMHQQPFTWADGGRTLLYTQGPNLQTGMDIWAVAIDGSSPPHPLMQTAANETQPAVSPDGRWLAWMTDASGRPEVMVRRYPDGPALPVSREGGLEPAWAPGGGQIFFRDLSGSSMMVADFTPGAPPVVGRPSVLFRGGYARCYIWCRGYDVSPDGGQFVMRRNPEGFTRSGYWTAGTEIRIVPHWDREVRARVRDAER